MKEFKIITDSCVDFNIDILKSKNLQVVPINTIIDDVEYGIDREYIDQQKFFKEMEAGKEPTTVAAKPTDLERIFKENLDKEIDFIYISFSSALSSSFANAHTVIDSLKNRYKDFKMYLIDSKAATASLDLIVDYALSLQAAGKDIDQVYEEVKNSIKNLHVEFIIKDLYHLMRGGRLSKTSAVLGTALKISPILILDDEGKISFIDKVRGRKRAIDKLLNNFSKSFDSEKFSKVIISHSLAEKDAKLLKEKLIEKFNVQVDVFDLVITIGAHTGPGTLILGYFKK